VTFGDLARRWAVDRHYGKSIDYIADLYRTEFCTGQQAQSDGNIVPPAPQPARRLPFQPPSGLGAAPPEAPGGDTDGVR
jgi:hypothetical protein